MPASKERMSRRPPPLPQNRYGKPVNSLASSIAMSTVQTITEAIPSLTLRNKSDQADPTNQQEPYKYAHLLPVFPKDEHYPPLTPFEHVDPGSRALSHPNPRAFLENAASVDDITPRLGTEVRGVNLAELDNAGRDQLALEVRTRYARFPPMTHLLIVRCFWLYETVGCQEGPCGVPRPAGLYRPGP